MYLIPAFVAIFTLMFAFASPLALAESSGDIEEKWTGQKHHKKHKIIEVEGFVGSLQITEDIDRKILRELVTVSLSEAANGLDVVDGHIGVVKNENNEKFLAWTLKSIDKNPETEIATVTIYVVDAVDIDNTATITKEVDRSKRDGKINQDGKRHSDRIEKLEQRFSQQTGNADIDAARATFVDKLQELKAAFESEDYELVSELRNELKDLKSGLGNKSFQK